MKIYVSWRYTMSNRQTGTVKWF
ncbi:cold-shock protein, partial [Pseudomonas sp. NPDC098740]